MKIKSLGRLIVLAILLGGGYLHAQLYNRLHAYDNGATIKAGGYHDVCNLYATSPWGEVPISVGRSAGFPSNGVISRFALNGVHIQPDELVHATGADVFGVTIDKGLNNHVVGGFFTPGGSGGESEILCFDLVTGNILWARRFPDFEVKALQVAPNPGGLPGETVIVTGRRSNARLPIFAIDYNTGNMVWGFNYNVLAFPSPPQSYAQVTGFDLHVDPVSNEITVAATGDRFTQTDMVILRTDFLGNPLMARLYGDSLGGDFYHGKCLTPSTKRPGYYYVGFEYSNTGSPQLHPGVMEIRPNGSINWMGNYPGTGFFNGNNFFVTDIDYIGDLGKDRILVTGYFDKLSTGLTTAYSLVLTGWGTGLIFNEYQSLANHTPIQTFIHGIERKPGQLRHSVVGNFEVDGGAASVFPGAPGVNTFWALGVSHTGNTGGALPCRTYDGANQNALNPDTVYTGIFPAFDTLTITPRLIANRANPLDAPNCRAAKTGFSASAGPAPEALSIQVEHDQVELLIQGEMTAPGTVEVLDMKGRILGTWELSQPYLKLSGNAWADGVYILRYELPGIGQGSRKVVFQR